MLLTDYMTRGMHSEHSRLEFLTRKSALSGTSKPATRIVYTLYSIHCVSKKYTTLCLLTTLSNVDRFSKFFHS